MQNKQIKQKKTMQSSTLSKVENNAGNPVIKARQKHKPKRLQCVVVSQNSSSYVIGRPVHL